MNGDSIVITINSEIERQKILELADNAAIGTSVEFKSREMTKSQKGAMYVWIRQMCEGLNDAGYTVSMFLDDLNRQNMYTSWTLELFKELAWKVMLKALTGKKSTENQSTEDVQKVYNELNRWFGTEKGVSRPWPNRRG